MDLVHVGVAVVPLAKLSKAKAYLETEVID